ncbi:LacI family DNA-binding transcriptional regulator [Rhizobium sp. Root149]|uniref:LacI family DNA-binding transcriptional regulator n=1 Tax=Rhizobium sp. Root149 TaxID=1736473 RepID=UPI0012E383F5|nr:LacI family DNA-binding transcriptional regulator [Rhizobium sp. Root149]
MSGKTPQKHLKAEAMRPPFPLKDIALQSGLSLATVDRALHGRGHVAKATGLRIEAAIAELERQYAEARIAGRRLVIDVVMETPQRFSNAVRAAFDAELPGMRPASLSVRFHVAETMEERDLLAILKRIRRRGSHGVVVKVPSTPAIAEMAAELMESGIPVVTLVTDLPATVRQGYVGMDNRVAGATAAYVLARMAGPAQGKVLVTLSSARFSGEEERQRGFRDALQKDAPHLGIVTISEGFGVDRTTERLVKAALVADPEIRAVYSIGGGNRAILRAFAEERRRIDVFAAHDLDADNRALLAEGRLTFVIHHDLRQDARSACQMVMAHHRMLPRDFQIAPSRVAIATPYEVL